MKDLAKVIIASLFSALVAGLGSVWAIGRDSATRKYVDSRVERAQDKLDVRLTRIEDKLDRALRYIAIRGAEQ